MNRGVFKSKSSSFMVELDESKSSSGIGAVISCGTTIHTCDASWLADYAAVLAEAAIAFMGMARREDRYPVKYKESEGVPIVGDTALTPAHVALLKALAEMIEADKFPLGK